MLISCSRIGMLISCSRIGTASIPVFCTADITKLPPAAPEAAGSLMTMFEVVARQEKHIQDLLTAVASIRADVQEHKDYITAVKPQGGGDRMTFAKQVMKAPLQGQRPQNPVATAAQQVPMQQQQHAGGGTRRQVDADGFEMSGRNGRNRRQAPRKAGAAGNSDILATGPNNFYVQITNVNDSADADTIKTYIRDKDGGIDVVAVEDTSSPDWDTKRFKLTFKMADHDKVMAQDFWPQRIYFKRWYPVRRKAGDLASNNG
jgi:hypothetical protein